MEVKCAGYDGKIVLAAECKEDLYMWITAINAIFYSQVQSSAMVEAKDGVVEGYMLKHHRGSVKRYYFELNGSKLTSYLSRKKDAVVRILAVNSATCSLELPTADAESDADDMNIVLPRRHTARPLFRAVRATKICSDDCRFALHFVSTDGALEREVVWF